MSEKKTVDITFTEHGLTDLIGVLEISIENSRSAMKMLSNLPTEKWSILTSAYEIEVRRAKNLLRQMRQYQDEF